MLTDAQKKLVEDEVDTLCEMFTIADHVGVLVIVSTVHDGDIFFRLRNTKVHLDEVAELTLGANAAIVKFLEGIE